MENVDRSATFPVPNYRHRFYIVSYVFWRLADPWNFAWIVSDLLLDVCEAFGRLVIIRICSYRRAVMRCVEFGKNASKLVIAFALWSGGS